MFKQLDEVSLIGAGFCPSKVAPGKMTGLHAYAYSVHVHQLMQDFDARVFNLRKPPIVDAFK